MPTFALSPGFINGLWVSCQRQHLFTRLGSVTGKAYGLSAASTQKNAAQAFFGILAMVGMGE